MKVRARVKLGGVSGARPASAIPPPRRTFIYPHRSVRVAPVSASRVALALGIAFGFSLLIGWGAHSIFVAHARFFGLLLQGAGVPVTGWVPASLYPLLPKSFAPLVTIPRNDAIPEGSLLLLVACIVVLSVLLRRVSLARSLVAFSIVLLVASGASVSLNDSYWFDSVMFTQLWMRSEVVLWLVLPWICSFLFIALQPNPLAGLAWTLGLEAWALVVSALRMTFCLGVLHYSGMLFFPLLWFFLGLFLTVSALLVAYSVAVQQASRRMEGVRRK